MPDTVQETDSIRDTLSAAFDAAEDAAPEPKETPSPASEEPEAPEAPREGRTRDERGRFAKEAKEQEPSTDEPSAPLARDGVAEKPQTAKVEGEKAAGEGVAAPSPAAPPLRPELERAPQSWRPAARDAWGKLAPEVREEVLRRERETSVVLQQSHEARAVARAFSEAVNPYLGMIRAEGGEPVKVVENLLQTAAALRTAPPLHRAQLVASIIQTYGVDLPTLDAVLAGKAPGLPAQPQVQHARQASQDFRDPRLDQLIEHQRRALAANTQREVDAFAKSHEFYEDVREVMADLLDLNDLQNKQREARGEAPLDMSLEEAYTRAVRLDPRLDAVMRQREAAKAARTPEGATRLRAATASVRGTPVGAVKARTGTSLRDDLDAALEDLS